MGARNTPSAEQLTKPVLLRVSDNADNLVVVCFLQLQIQTEPQLGFGLQKTFAPQLR